MDNNNFQKLRQLISEDKILLLPHKKYNESKKMLIYARCGMSKEYFEKAYKDGDVIVQVDNSGLRIGYPIAWQKALEEV